jgi:[protein-PII] uridylyltransferase
MERPASDPRISCALIRQKRNEAIDELVARFKSGLPVGKFLKALSSLVDNAMREILRWHPLPDDASLVAVGGYGRRELFPYSDVDVLILLRRPPLAHEAAALESLISNMWDAGLELGHSVRTIDECIQEANSDVTVQTGLVETRHISGNAGLTRELAKRLFDGFNGRAFLEAKRLEQEQRHAKYEDTPYSLEPNIKESPGGLRDLQMILWVTRACHLGDNWIDLARKGYITRTEANAIAHHERILKDFRARVQIAAGRREDRLLFEYQSPIAEQLGFQRLPHRRASEQLMERYYRTAKSVTQLNTIVLQNLTSELSPSSNSIPTRLDNTFIVQNELLGTIDPDEFSKNPISILRSILALQQHPELKGMTAQTLRSLWRSRVRIDRKFRALPEARTLFLDILKQPRGLVHALRRMNQYSILGRYIPAFGRVVGQMQHDLFHVYTVDQHILTVARNLRRFTMLEFAHEYPMCSRLIAEFENGWLLYIAAIFHDIAKGRGGDHSELGSRAARKFCTDHGIRGDDRELIGFLVQSHLTMSSVAQKQDLSDPEVIRRFADLVGTERRLIALYLLTVADIRGTSPKVWNAWKAKLLEDLFNSARRYLAGSSIDVAEGVQQKQEEARRLLRLYALSEGVEQSLWMKLDIPYFLRHDASEIAWHSRLLYNKVSGLTPVVRARLSPIGEGLQVLIYVPDQESLFARICGFFESIAYNIVDAKIHTTRHGYALDTFQVLGVGQSTNYRDMIRLVEHELQQLLESKAPLRDAISGRISRQVRHFPMSPEIHIRADEKGEYFVLSVIAGDRPGLLYSIAKILGEYEVRLQTAKIATLGHRAEDTFVVSGSALHNPQRTLMLEQDILHVLQTHSSRN